jgi:DNA polymerase-3 subunit alpha
VLLTGLDIAMDWGAKRQGDLRIGQTNMLDLLPDHEALPALPNIEEWPTEEKLKNEKEALGLYITGHPLRRYEDHIKRMTNMDTEKCRQVVDKSEIAICGMVSSMKEIVTKKGARMCFITLEDLVGSVEVVVFSDLYSSVSLLLKKEVPIYLKGQVDHNEDSIKILAREIVSLEEVRKKRTREVHLSVEKTLMNPKAFEELKGILLKYPGSIPTYLHLLEPNKKETILALPPDLEVELSDGFIHEVQKMLGGSSLQYQ